MESLLPEEGTSSSHSNYHKGGQIGANEKPNAPSTTSKKSKRKAGKSAETKATKTKSKTRRKVAPIRKTRIKRSK
jgi:hypothetical protein